MCEAELGENVRPRLDWADRALLAPRRAQRQAERETERLLARIRAAIERGDQRTAASLQGILLRSSSGKIVAVKEATKKRRHQRSVGSPTAQRLQPVSANQGQPGVSVRPRTMVEIALTLDMEQPPAEEVIVYPKQKGPSDYRPIHVFGLGNHARQLLFNRALGPFLALDGTRQFAWSGGRQTAARTVMRHIEDGARFACEVDIRCFYESISRGWVCVNLPIPEEITRATVIPDDRQYQYKGWGLSTSWRPLSPIGLNARAVRGMPQGSACSAIIGEFIVAQILSALPPESSVVNYADNFLVLGRTRREVEQTLQTLAGAVGRHPAGEFALTAGKIRQTSWGFDFLGYHFESYQGRAFVQASEAARHEAATKIVRVIRAVAKRQPHSLRRLQLYCRGWASSFALWPAVSRVVEAFLFWSTVRLGRDAIGRLNEIMCCAPHRGRPA